MATVKDIAKIAGVSTATVSRALAEPDKVANSTRLKVEKVAADIGYLPNAMARNLRRSEAKSIVVIIPDITNPMFTDIITGLESIAHRKNYNVLIGDAGNEPTRAQNYFELVESKQVDGVLSLTSDIPESALIHPNGSLRFPVVMACEYHAGSTIPSVHIDNEFSAKKAIEYLIVMGHYKIACITGPIDNPNCKSRLKGFTQSMKQRDLIVPEHFIVEGDFSFFSGYSLARQLLSNPDRPTAIFCHSDEIAIGVLKMASELNIKVPEQLSVIGFDNIANSEYCAPGLTTIHQPGNLIGESAMKLLLDILSGKKPNPELTLPTQLIVRESSAPPPIEFRIKTDL